MPGRIKSSKLALLRDHVTVESQPEKYSCLYMCQHCLVHLGDIARYRNQNIAAETFYQHAVQLLPNSGHPYNQLAILASANNDILRSSFFYCRSIAVKGPFSGSTSNLERQLGRILGMADPPRSKPMITTDELLKYFLKFHACIILGKKDNELGAMISSLSDHIRLHLRGESLSYKQWTHMIFMNLYSLGHLSKGGIRDGEPIEEVKTAAAPAALRAPPNLLHQRHPKVVFLRQKIALTPRFRKENFGMQCLILQCTVLERW